MSKYNLKDSASTPKAKAKRIATPKADAAEPVNAQAPTGALTTAQWPTATATPAQEKAVDAERLEAAKQGAAPFTLRDYKRMRDRGAGPLSFASM